MKSVGSPGDQDGPFRDSLEVLAESIETLCTVEFTTIGPGRGIVRPLYMSAVAAQGDVPMLQAARRLLGSLAPGGVCMMSTGIVIPGVMPVGESDGPPGLLVLASVLARTLGVTSVLVAEPETHPSLVAGADKLALPVLTAEAVLATRASSPLGEDEKTAGIVVIDFPTDADPATAESLLDRWRPGAIVVSEKLGLNVKGVPHTSTGMRLVGPRLPFELVVRAARGRRVPTIAVGDGGNEIGFGLIREAVEEHKPYGRTCQCGCGAGLACADACDYLIVATVSNWGCYGLAAMLTALLEVPDALPTSRELDGLLEAIAALGVIDGATGQATASVDGVDGYVERAVLDMLGSIVRMALTRRPKRTF